MVYHPAMVDKLLAQELATPILGRADRRVKSVIGEVKKFDAGEAALAFRGSPYARCRGELTYGVVYGVPLTPFIPPMRVMQPIVGRPQEDAVTIDRYERLASEGEPAGSRRRREPG
ncbi:MAG: hypothetical protein MRJ92_00580 [Nitrospira sp.]|nr:hypothetical protein [Nitrospira sp.]